MGSGRERIRVPETLYVKAQQCCQVTEDNILLGNVLKMWCKNKDILTKCMAIKLVHVKDKSKENRFVFSILDIVQLIQKNYPNVDVENMGNEDFIVQYKKSSANVLWWEWTKAIFVFIVVFVGSAFAIMTFNEDVNVSEVFENVYYLVTGSLPEGFNILQAGYCVGLAVGILVFYNHFCKKKVTSDPTPLDVELRSYETDIYTTVIDNYYRDEDKKERGSK